jgi:hypothetical protein
MLTISQLPAWIQTGELYRIMSCDLTEDSDYEMIRPLKTDFVFSGLRDVIELLDTAHYMGVDKLPEEVYRYCRETPDLLLEMNEFENHTILEEYSYFIQTDEYKAFRICAETYSSILLADEINSLLYIAIQRGNMSLLRYCVEDCGICHMDHFRTAVSYKRIDMCKYIICKFPEWTHSIRMDSLYCGIAASIDDLPMLIYLRETVGVIWTEETIHFGIRNQNIQCAIYAIKNGCPIPKFTIDIAIHDNSLPLVQALIEQKDIHTKNEYCLNFAIQLGRIEIAKLLYANGAKPNIHTIQCASSHECIAFANRIINETS